jgi:hypothetical protein
MKSKTFILICGLELLLVASIFFIYIQAKQIRQLKGALDHLIPGEKIKYLDLVGMHQDTFDAAMLRSDKMYLLFIFKMPCSTCNRNIGLWRQMTKILDGGVEILGIIPGEFAEAANFEEKTEGRIKFKLFVPADIAKFKEKMRIRENSAQTILYCNKVEFVKVGDLNGDEYTTIIKRAKKYNPI